MIVIIFCELQETKLILLVGEVGKYYFKSIIYGQFCLCAANKGANLYPVLNSQIPNGLFMHYSF